VAVGGLSLGKADVDVEGTIGFDSSCCFFCCCRFVVEEVVSVR
jgi:hypothetical protein